MSIAGKMTLSRRALDRLTKRSFWILSVKAVILTVAIVSGASITVTTRNYQSQVGSALQVASTLIATDKGFSLASSSSSSAGTSCTTPVLFSTTPGIASTGITSGHMVYDVQVNSTGSSPPSAKFNVTLVLAGTTYGPLCIQDNGAPINGQTIDCKFDVGLSLPAPPYTFKVTVQ
jgi:hypothetical protein